MLPRNTEYSFSLHSGTVQIKETTITGANFILSRVKRKVVFGVPDQHRHKPDSAVTEISKRFEISDLGSNWTIQPM